MATMDTMPTMSDPGQDIDSRWKKEQERITRDWYKNSHPLAAPSESAYQDFYNQEAGKEPMQKIKENWMGREFGSAQDQAITNQRNLAKQFRQGMPGYEQSIYDQINANSKYAIANQQDQIKKAANERGLLYSGLKTGSINNAAADISSQAAGQRSRVAPEMNKMADELDQRAIETMQAKQVSDLNLANNVFDRALQDAQARMAATGSMMNTVGQIGGTVAGNYFAKNKGTT